ncbi:ABC transporter substrate-binding protein [Paenibacillus sp.]|uniref:ABC transporter substrate-binding protein n=1 Tax=Paenibacillus sp. TaxID=58172 RepID=UPI002D73CAB6|nr:ABC transporter substrate-binding protein [Paenibacillus sp.]HZG58779.1 ABC transporter substrate-binding protein [Paenibacillus sp.]
MKGFPKTMLRLTVLALSLMLVLGACSNGGSGTEPAPAPADSNSNGTTAETPKDDPAPAEEPKLEEVELVWYYPQPSNQPDLQKIQDAVNKITLEAINAKVTLKPIDFGDYTQKMNTVVASGEKFDIAWTANWAFFYGPNVTKGAFLPLDDLLAEHGKEIQAEIPSFVWDATRVNGKIYAVPNYQTVTNREGFVVQKRFADKYGLDPSAIKTERDIQPFLEKVAAGEPDIVPFGMDRNGGFSAMANGIEYVGAHVIGIHKDDPYKAIVIPQTEAYKNNVTMIREWYEKGLVNKDAATVKAFDDIVKTGKLAVVKDNVMPPGGEVGEKASNGGHDVVYVYLTEPYTGTNTIITTMQAISRTSENPGRAMMFINLLNTNKDLYNLLAFGIEGTHYSKLSDNMVKINPDAGYNPNTNWVFGNTFNGYLVEGQSQEIMDAVKHENETATPSPLMGFSFNDENVKAEIANISALGDQYSPGLGTGAVDPAKVLPEYLDKLQKAGVEKVREEVQRQIDEWRKANGK